MGKWETATWLISYIAFRHSPFSFELSATCQPFFWRACQPLARRLCGGSFLSAVFVVDWLIS